MEKKNWSVAIAAIVGLLVLAGVVTAQGMWRSDNGEDAANGDMPMHGMMGMGNMAGMGGMMQHHEDMEKVMEEGTYSDLVKLREELGFNMMPWVENEEDFELAQKIHEKMGKSHEENGMGMMVKGHKCPMMG